MRWVAALAVAVVLSMAGYGVLNLQHGASAASPVTQPDSVYSAWQFGATFVHQGVPRVDHPFLPDGQPAVSRQDAIAAVKAAHLNGVTGYTITAKYGLFTTEAQNKDGSLQYDNTPVWAVRIEGIKWSLPVPTGHRGITTDHYVYIVNAATGELGAGFSV